MSRQISAIRDQVETGLSLLKPYCDSADTPEFRARAGQILGRIRFGKTGYIFVYDYDGICSVLSPKLA
jgi:signal transduction histidine kinase